MAGALRETQNYVRSLERGLTLFDVPPEKVATDMAQWAPVLAWLQPVLKPAPVAEPRPRESVLSSPLRGSVLAGARTLNDARRLATPAP